MKVKDLIIELEKHDKELDVYTYCEDRVNADPEIPYQVLWIDSVELNMASIKSNANYESIIEFDGAEDAKKAVFINITSKH